MGHNNINYLNRSDKDNMESIITPYGLKFSIPMMRLESMLRQKLKSIKLIVTMKQTETHFVLIHLIKTEHFASLVVTNIKCGKT